VPGTGVKKYQYNELLSSSYDQVEQIASGSVDFQIIADQKVGHRIERFLANEAVFRRSARRLADRVRYFFRALVGFTISGFLPVWNKAVMNGCKVTIGKAGEEVVICFHKNQSDRVADSN
jgi:hypothetical protein